MEQPPSSPEAEKEEHTPEKISREENVTGDFESMLLNGEYIESLLFGRRNISNIN